MANGRQIIGIHLESFVVEKKFIREPTITKAIPAPRGVGSKCELLILGVSKTIFLKNGRIAPTNSQLNIPETINPRTGLEMFTVNRQRKERKGSCFFSSYGMYLFKT